MEIDTFHSLKSNCASPHLFFLPTPIKWLFMHILQARYLFVTCAYHPFSNFLQAAGTQREYIPSGKRVWEWTWREIGKGLYAIFDFIAGYQDGSVELRREDRVPRFWADSDGGAIANMIVLGLGVCFGAIHCISWGFSFPTHAELLMWRVSCVAITAVPIYISLGFCLVGFLGGTGFGITVFIIFSLSGGILYISSSGDHLSFSIYVS